MASAESRPLYMEFDGSAQLGIFHPPAAGQRRRPVLMVPPWGWEEVASYRARRDWALQLAEVGHPTLRFSLPGTGNSSGTPADADLLNAWVGGVGVAAGRLSELCAGEKVAAVGLGLGGLLVLAAVADSPIEEAALWGSPKDGSAYVREVRAFSRLEQLPDTGEGIPDGWLEAGGFVLASETIAALRHLSAAVPEGSLRRTLLLGRNTKPPEKLEEALRAAAAEVSVDDGEGWQNFVESPETAEFPDAVASRFEQWLRDGEGPSASGGAVTLSEPEVASARMTVDGTQIREEARFLEAGWGRAFVIISAPVEAGAAGPAAIFLNAGAVNTPGPNRMWVEISRAAAKAGTSAVRVDLQGIGEADGEDAGVLQAVELNRSRYGDQVRALVRELPRLIGADEFVTIGLCAGGRNAFQSAFEPGVVEVIMLNGSAIRWSDDLRTRREEAELNQSLRRRPLKKLLRGEIPPARLLPFLRSLSAMLVRRSVAALRRLWSRREPTYDELVEADLERAAAAGTRLLLAFSGDEGLHRELVRSGIAAKILATDGFTITELPGRDHTLRPASSQAVLRDLVLDQLRERTAEAAATVDQDVPAHSATGGR